MSPADVMEENRPISEQDSVLVIETDQVGLMSEIHETRLEQRFLL